MLREARRIRTGEVELSTTIAGTGPPLLLLHGFPDSAEVWRYQLPILVEAGYSVIAPDMRGFGRSDAPADRAAYRIDHILDDILGLLRSLDITQRVGLVGHDWGAAVGWIFCMRHADRVSRYAALSVGHPAAIGLGVKRPSTAPCGATLAIDGSEQVSSMARPRSVASRG